MTNCERCCAEIEDDLVQRCEACEADGLCEGCLMNHECEGMSDPVIPERWKEHYEFLLADYDNGLDVREGTQLIEELGEAEAERDSLREALEKCKENHMAYRLEAIAGMKRDNAERREQAATIERLREALFEARRKATEVVDTAIMYRHKYSEYSYRDGAAKVRNEVSAIIDEALNPQPAQEPRK